MVRYTLLRFLIFFGCLGLLWLVGLRSPEQRPWLLVAAAALSIAISYVVLAPFREQTVQRLTERTQARIQAKQGLRDEDVEDRATEDYAAQDGDTGGSTAVRGQDDYR